MPKRSIFQAAAFIFIGALLLSSCNPTATQAPDNIQTTPSETPDSEVATQDNQPLSDEDDPTEEPAPTPPGPTPTPIVETRLPPEQWQAWPVVPELTGLETAIYQQGLSLGNDPGRFSKVGDCQAISEVLMGIYDKPGRYVFTDVDAHLQETVDHFAGSFDRDGQGVRGGFNAAAVISPIWADPEVCQPGENPIECENRTHNPSFVIISLEVWWEGRTVERYEDYMRQIVDYYIDEGVVPILSTKADNVEGDHRINLATARLAYEYHLPLWNFWRAVQSLPNHGIDPNRDGFHISYQAWTVRSYTALQALDAVWREVRDQAAAAEEPVSSPGSSVAFADLTLSPAPDSQPIVPENESLVFSLEQRVGDSSRSAGIFGFDLVSNTLHQIHESGFRLEDSDSTGAKLLVSQGGHLYISDPAGDDRLVTDQLALTGRKSSAFWMPDDERLVVLTGDGANRTLWLVDPRADTWQTIVEGEIAGMIKPASDTTFYWYQGQCTPDSACEDNTLWHTQSGVSEPFAEQARVAFSRTGDAYAWTEMTEGTSLILYTRNAEQTLQDYLYLPGNRGVDLAWSPFGNRLVLLTVTRSEYSGRSSDARVFLVDAAAMTHLEYYAFPGLNPAVTWSADAGELMLTSTLAVEDGYQIHFRRLNLTSGIFTDLDEVFEIGSEDFVTIDQLFWIYP